MKKITLGIIAHVDSGKTTLSEALLYLTGTIRKFGRVDKGASFLDDQEMERARGITIYSKQARFICRDTEFVLIDTPGHADFSAEMERTLQVLDYAVLLISAADGIQGQTEQVFRLLEQYQIPVFVFFNKMDQPGADRNGLMRDFRGKLSTEAVDFTEKDRSQWYDAIAMCSEEAMEQFLETGMVEDDLIRMMIKERKLFPCFFGAALKQEGVEAFLQALDHYTLQPCYPEAFAARVYKITRDSDGSRLTMMKITGGTLKARAVLPDGETEGKVHQIRIYNGSRFTLRDEVRAGEICAVTGLKSSFAGQGFGLDEQEVLPLVAPVLRYRAVLLGGDDPVKALGHLRTLEEENPELSVTWEETHQSIYVSVMGEVQLQILTSLLQERFGLNVTFDDGEIMYRETITKPVIGAGHFEPLRHYAEVQLLLEPLERGRGIVLENAADSDRLATNWQRLILTNLAEKQHRGVLTGSPLTDVRITLLTGKAHLKHTEGGDFRQAVYRAVRQGLMMTESLLLEPYYRFSLTIPAENVGRAMTDLDRAGAAFEGPQMDGSGQMAVITGRGPVSSLKDYAQEVTAYTRGRGQLQLTGDGYDTCLHAKDVIDAKAYDPLADVRNTPDSVFCTHGSGYIVPYHEVYRHLHTPLGGYYAGYLPKELGGTRLLEDVAASAGEEGTDPVQEPNRSIGTEEIDEIISRISGANRRDSRKDSKKRSGWNRRPGSDKALVSTGKTAGAVKSPELFPLEMAEQVIVDGYNVIFAWQELSDLARVNIDSARDALIDILSEFSSMIDARVSVAFDAYKVKGHTAERMTMQGIEVLYTSQDETADQYIERFTNANGRKQRIAVITSDGLEQIITRGQGCLLISSRELKTYMERLRKELREQFHVRQQ